MAGLSQDSIDGLPAGAVDESTVDENDVGHGAPSLSVVESTPARRRGQGAETGLGCPTVWPRLTTVNAEATQR